ncbi:unnamed protein product [Gordionus sp. m RMFG-2023]
MNIGLIIADLLIFSPKNITIDVFEDLPAEFGSIIPLSGLTGYVVISNPAKACSPILSPPFNYSLRRWFVLIERNGCDFDYKVLNAQRAGYAMAIIYNFENDELIPMHGYKYVKMVNIPSIFIGWTAGIKILKSYTQEHGNYAKITGELPFSLNNYLLPFAVVIGLCFIMMVIFLTVKFMRERRYRMRNRLTARNLKSIPVKKYHAGDALDTCAVCLEDYNDGDKLRILPCSHAYHSQCIDPWLTKNKRNCPICKRKIVFGRKKKKLRSKCHFHHNRRNGDSIARQDESTPLLSSTTHQVSTPTTSKISLLAKLFPSSSKIPSTSQYVNSSPRDTSNFKDDHDGLDASNTVTILEVRSEPERHHSHPHYSSDSTFSSHSRSRSSNSSSSNQSSRHSPPPPPRFFTNRSTQSTRSALPHSLPMPVHGDFSSDNYVSESESEKGHMNFSKDNIRSPTSSPRDNINTEKLPLITDNKAYKDTQHKLPVYSTFATDSFHHVSFLPAIENDNSIMEGSRNSSINLGFQNGLNTLSERIDTFLKKNFGKNDEDKALTTSLLERVQLNNSNDNSLEVIVPNNRIGKIFKQKDSTNHVNDLDNTKNSPTSSRNLDNIDKFKV